jgi:tagatose-6-phosphate ketose/aldose isomerase
VRSFHEILSLPATEKRRLGVEFTPSEILQQPDAWRETAALVESRGGELSAFLRAAGCLPGSQCMLLLLGAGTSEYIGASVEDSLRRHLAVSVQTVPTTSFITHPADHIMRGRPCLMIHFARSGDSPESLGSFEYAHAVLPEAHHLIITCNREGRLARAAAHDSRTHVILLPERTNDRSLVMTSSFSSMVVAALAVAHLDSMTAFRRDLDGAARSAERLLAESADRVQGFAEKAGTRIQFLGTGACHGAMKESRLKVLEMTDGRIAANVDTFLGLRHGPRVFVNGECLVVASISRDEHRRRYQTDLLRELRAARQGMGTLALCDLVTPDLDGLADELLPMSPTGAGLPDELRAVTDVVVGQLTGLFASLRLGLKPDAPSTSGVINRVVSGVRIYPLAGPTA